MHTYTNVMFDRGERQVLEIASRHLGVAYPDVHTEMPRKKVDRSPDHEARVVFGMVRDTGQGTHENITRAVAVLAHLVEVLTEQAQLEYWLKRRARETGATPEHSTEPTSSYQQLRMLSEIREDQLRDANRALELLRTAALLASPPAYYNVDTGEFEHGDACDAP